MTISPHDYANSEDSILLQHIKAQQWDEAMTCVHDYSHVPDEYGNLPLHAAVGFQAPDDLILNLLDQYPTATQQPGSDDWLPLHIAAMYGCSTAVLEALIRAYPQGLDHRGQQQEQDKGQPSSSLVKGRTPRHFAARFEHNRALLERST